jgi:hypothetical protein
MRQMRCSRGFPVDGRLAFSIQKGVTEGQVSLTNNDPFTIDAIFGVTLEKQYDKSIKGFSKRLITVPLSPFTIPGIITLGPLLKLDSTLDLVLNGKAELLIGGSLAISPETYALSLIRKEDNKVTGSKAKFTPVAKVSWSKDLKLGKHDPKLINLFCISLLEPLLQL